MKLHLLPLLLCLAAPVAADTVFLINGARQEGVFAGIKNGKVILKTGKKQNLIPRSKVASLSFARDNEPALETRIFQNNNVPAGGRLYEETYQLNDDMSSKRTAHTVNIFYDGHTTYLEGYQTAKLEYARLIKNNSVLYSTAPYRNICFNEKPYDFLHQLAFGFPGAYYTGTPEMQYAVLSQEHYKSFPFAGFFECPANALCRLKIAIPKQRGLKYAPVNIQPEIKFEEKETGEKHVYSWEFLNDQTLRPSLFPEDLPGPGLWFALEDSWESVRSFISAQIDRRLDADKELAALAKQIAPESLPAAKRAEFLFNWVKDNVRLINVFMGDAPYVPRNASQILASKTGNHLDKPFLLYALLKAAGFDCSLLYAGYKLMPEVPAITQFSRAFVLVTINGREMCLDIWQGSFSAAASTGQMFVAHGRYEKLFYNAPREDMRKWKEVSDISPNGAANTFWSDWDGGYDKGVTFTTTDFIAYQLLPKGKDVLPQEITKPIVFSGGAHTETRTADIAIPEGFQPYRLPQNISEEIACCSYKAEYSIKGRTVHLEETFQRNHNIIFPSDYPAARELRLKYSQTSRIPLIFIKNRAH